MRSRRRFLHEVAAVGWVPALPPSPLDLPLHVVTDARIRWAPGQLDRFWTAIWPEAYRDFAACGIRLHNTAGAGDVRRSPGGRPIFTGLVSGGLNLVITDQIPLNWDRGRGLAGVTARYEGFHICVIALSAAHGHQCPYVSVNTCVHELLHALMGDIYEARPAGWLGDWREFRIDRLATELWLFHEGAEIHAAAARYLEHWRRL